MIRYFLCVRRYWRKIIEQIVGLLLLLILKSSYQRPSVKKDAFKSFANSTGKHPRTCNFLKKRPQHRYFSSEKQVFPVFSSEIFETLLEKVFVNPCFCIFTGNFIYNPWNKCSYRGVIRTLWNRYDGVFFVKTVSGF